MKKYELEVGTKLEFKIAILELRTLMETTERSTIRFVFPYISNGEMRCHYVLKFPSRSPTPCIYACCKNLSELCIKYSINKDFKRSEVIKLFDEQYMRCKCIDSKTVQSSTYSISLI